ncbi:MAG: hypothetical protein AABZ53_14350 [Planctomycetota bacterium]
MHPSVSAIFVLLLGWMLFRVARRALRALFATRIVEIATACSCGYSMAGIPFGVCPECGRPHDLIAPRPLGRSRIVLGLLLTGWTACVALGAWGAFAGFEAILPPIETNWQSLTLNSTAGDIRFQWTIVEPRTNPHADSVRVMVRPTKALPSVTPIHGRVTASDMTPPAPTPDAPAPVDELLASIVDRTPDLDPADGAALAADLRTIIAGALKGSPAGVLVPRAARAGLYWGSGSGGRWRVAPRVQTWPFYPAAALAWACGTLLIVRKWEARLMA